MTVEQVTKRVQRILTNMVGSATIDADGDFVIRFDSATVFVRVFDTSIEVVMVRVFALVLLDVPLTPDLYRWVATEGDGCFFGYMRVIEDGDGTGRLLFEHHLLGEYLDPDELEFAVETMGAVADNLDDELKARFGGVRFNEK